MARPLRVAIVGAGMGGLATAAALRRVGIEVAVYEQAAQFARLGAGIQVGCNAMKVLRELGLEPKMRQQSFYPRSWNNRDWRTGDVKFDMIFGETAERKFGARICWRIAETCMRRSRVPFPMSASSLATGWSDLTRPATA